MKKLENKKVDETKVDQVNGVDVNVYILQERVELLQKALNTQEEITKERDKIYARQEKFVGDFYFWYGFAMGSLCVGGGWFILSFLK